MTEEEIKKLVVDYIISGHESDNADCLHEKEEFDDHPDDLNRAYELYRKAILTVWWEEI